MPPKGTRRTSGQTSVRGTQGTLAFGTQGPNKITKPSSSSSAAKNSTKPLSKPAVAAVVEAVATPSPAPESVENDTEPELGLSPGKALAIRKQSLGKAEGKKRDAKEEKALRVSDAQIKRYWKGKEEARIAPRVHQQGLSLNEKVLREFDLSSQFGPCIGIPRVKRWKRADGLGLQPPLEVLAVLLKEEEMGNEKAERAFMDGLLSSRLAENQ